MGGLGGKEHIPMAIKDFSVFLFSLSTLYSVYLIFLTKHLKDFSPSLVLILSTVIICLGKWLIQYLSNPGKLVLYPT